MSCALTLNRSSESHDSVQKNNNEVFPYAWFTQGKITTSVLPELQTESSKLLSFELIAPGVPSWHTMQASRTMKHWPKPWPNLSIKHQGKKDIMVNLSECVSVWCVLCAWTVHWAFVSGDFLQIQQSQSSLKMNQITMLSWGLLVLCDTSLCSCLGSAP